ncbi:type II toxin-antitoxin system VapC family toxin [uncultured Sphingomonas sp.]|uniref:type II toxin-antitoxin system VapC family toxin n=1 Tax=uncultured Sphingomonas sp. TaxID=158754 RepID=UPI002590B94C|nr:type II toxin-antitoxin system VapC family toxin [uncultured Sphingomonas sp.]
MTLVVDSSVVLAFLLGEPGGERLAQEAGPLLLSTVNLTEVLTKVVERGGDPDLMASALRPLSIEPVEHRAEDAMRAARLRTTTRHIGLSLGDRACLALAQRLAVPVLTADHAWAELDVGIDIRLIR